MYDIRDGKESMKSTYSEGQTRERHKSWRQATMLKSERKWGQKVS